MKRFWLVLLSLGLIAAFSTQAMAVDVKFSGEYFAAGMYLDRVGVRNIDTLAVWDPIIPTPPPGAPQFALTRVVPGDSSTALYYQRLRLNTQFVVHPGLTLVTRADIMERAWGAARFAPASGPANLLAGTPTALDERSAGTRAENENIAFDLLYVQYVSPIGLFLAGYQIDGAWGTTFGDTSMPTPKIGYILPIKDFMIGLQMGKNPDGELSWGTWNGSVRNGAIDRDNNFYTAFVRYGTKGLEAGLLGKYIRDARNRNFLGDTGVTLPFDAGINVQQFVVSPYAKAQLGPVALEGQVYYVTGRVKAEGLLGAATGRESQKIDAWSAYLDATADFGIAYVGGSFAWISGDKQETGDKLEGGLSGGLDWNPCLIMFNSERNYWVGGIQGYDDKNNGAPMTNAFFAQLRAGVKPVDKLDVMASLSWAKMYRADAASLGVQAGRDYGIEVDVTGTYKITNNLSYMLGAGYWFVGKYYKGAGIAGDTDASGILYGDVKNDFMVINKLTLTF